MLMPDSGDGVSSSPAATTMLWCVHIRIRCTYTICICYTYMLIIHHMTASNVPQLLAWGMPCYTCCALYNHTFPAAAFTLAGFFTRVVVVVAAVVVIVHTLSLVVYLILHTSEWLLRYADCMLCMLCVLCMLCCIGPITHVTVAGSMLLLLLLLFAGMTCCVCIIHIIIGVSVCINVNVCIVFVCT